MCRQLRLASLGCVPAHLKAAHEGRIWDLHGYNVVRISNLHWGHAWARRVWGAGGLVWGPGG
jgi:hypothetical protein